jgi:hypothetical protein
LVCGGAPSQMLFLFQPPPPPRSVQLKLEDAAGCCSRPPASSTFDVANVDNSGLMKAVDAC